MFENPVYLLISLCLLTLFSLNSGYADNNFIPKLSLQQEYVDNTTVTRDESGYVTRLSPGFNYKLKGRKLELSADYQLDLLNYDGLPDQHSQENHNLDMSASLTHIPGYWQSSANASIRQVNVSNGGVVIINPNLDSSNKQELRTLSVDSTFQSRNDRMDFSAGINLNISDYEDEPQTQGGHLNLGLGNRLTGNKTTWTANLNSTVDEQNDQSTQIDEIQLNLFYRFNSKLEGYIQSSKTQTDTNPVAAENDLDISSYLVGVNWKASKSLFISAGAGERGNEPNYSLDAKLQGKHTTLSMKYSERVTTNRRILLQQPDINTAPDLAQSMSIVPILYKRLDIGLEVKGRRSRAGVNIFQSQQSNGLTTADDEDILNGNLYFSRDSSARSTWTVDLLFQETENNNNNKLKDLNLGYQYQLTRYSSINLSLRHSNQDSDEVQNEYTQQSLGVTYSLSGI